jgi:very-short-patch-repair endonuclease
MPPKRPSPQTQRARTLRQTATKAEQLLWRLLRNRNLSQLKFRRQHPVGPYIADFACLEFHLIIEADGGQHTPETDAPRTAWLTKNGWRLLRLWNNEILQNPEGAIEKIRQALTNHNSHPPNNPSPAP